MAVVRTVVLPPSGVHGFGHYRTVGVVGRPLGLAEAQGLVDRFHTLGIHLAIRPGPTVRITAMAPLTTKQEVAVSRAVRDRTDAAIAWAGVLRPLDPTCVLCDAREALVHDLCTRCALVFPSVPQEAK